MHLCIMRCLLLAVSFCGAISSNTYSIGAVESNILLQVEHKTSRTAYPHAEASTAADRGKVVDEDEEQARGLRITRIFKMCLVMYGGIALLWLLSMQSSHREHLRVLLLCVAWSSTSIGMHVLNKALVDYLHAPAVISAVQMGITVGVVGFKSCGELRSAPLKQLMQWMIVPAFFAGMLITAFYAYEKISLTLMTLVRNLTPLMMLPMESLLMAPEKRPTVSFPVIAGILIMLVGALVYSGGNMSTISLLGVGFAVMNMVVAVSDRLIQRRLLTTECKDLSTGMCTLLNNLFGMVPTLILATATGQLQGTAQNAAWMDPKVLLLLLFSGLVGTGISVLGIECQRAISATSFSVMQNASKVGVVSAGIIVFADPIGSPISLLGLSMSLSGSFLYGWTQQMPQKASTKEADYEESGSNTMKVK
jgi:hypothetical protein